jgi:hypothetical protein
MLSVAVGRLYMLTVMLLWVRVIFRSKKLILLSFSSSILNFNVGFMLLKSSNIVWMYRFVEVLVQHDKACSQTANILGPAISSASAYMYIVHILHCCTYTVHI